MWCCAICVQFDDDENDDDDDDDDFELAIYIYVWCIIYFITHIYYNNHNIASLQCRLRWMNYSSSSVDRRRRREKENIATTIKLMYYIVVEGAHKQERERWMLRGFII